MSCADKAAFYLAVEYLQGDPWSQKTTVFECEHDSDGILGVCKLLEASRGMCTFKGGFNCSVYTVFGSVITAASVADLALAFIVGVFFDRVLTTLDKHTRKVRSQLLAMYGEAHGVHSMSSSSTSMVTFLSAPSRWGCSVTVYLLLSS